MSSKTPKGRAKSRENNRRIKRKDTSAEISARALNKEAREVEEEEEEEKEEFSRENP